MMETRTILCIASYEKGQAFLVEAAAQGARVVLLTAEKLRSANWPWSSLAEVHTMPDDANPADVLRRVHTIVRHTHIDRVVPLDEFDLEAAARGGPATCCAVWATRCCGWRSRATRCCATSTRRRAWRCWTATIDVGGEPARSHLAAMSRDAINAVRVAVGGDGTTSYLVAIPPDQLPPVRSRRVTPPARPTGASGGCSASAVATGMELMKIASTWRWPTATPAAGRLPSTRRSGLGTPTACRCACGCWR